MNVAVTLQQYLQTQEADEALIDLIPSLEALLPQGVIFDHNTWDLLGWKTRKGTAKCFNVFFNRINNHELRTFAKLYALERRQSRQVAPETVKATLPAIERLDQALGPRPINKISNAIFIEAQGLIADQVKDTAAPRQSDYLQAFGQWLSANLGCRISYKSTLTSVYLHGRKANDVKREAKLIDSRIVVDLIAANQRNDLIIKDRFFLSAFALLAGTGFRITELATLPKDCLVNEGENVGIRFFPEKKPKLDTRWLLPDWVPVAEDAIKKLVDITNSGRETVAAVRQSPGFDWSAIFQDKEAAQYFAAKFCHKWTDNPQNNMFNKTGAWLEKEKRYIDVVNLVKEAGSKLQASKRSGLGRGTIDSLLAAQQAALRNELPTTAKSLGKAKRTSWDTDSRVVSIARLEQYSGLVINNKSRKGFDHIVGDARDNYQLKGRVYLCPPHSEELERRFKRVIHPLVESKDGKPILQPEDALFITPKYHLHESRGTKTNNYSLISEKAFSRWFCGEKRSLGTQNSEDSCFSRLEIIDPKTGEIAKFTSHDIRHWLTTYLLEGGMASDQVALLFNRSADQNDTYDQTSSKTRLTNMRQAIRDGGAMGHVADTYHEITEYSRIEAEQYLEACTLQLNLMPHGGCSLNWGMKACPNHNGCFNGEGGLCEHLCINLNDQDTKLELKRMEQETETALLVIPEQSPQYTHYQNIQRNLKGLCGDSHND